MSTEASTPAPAAARTKPRVFISYAHESEEHRAAALELANRLRADGLEAWIDQYREDLPGDWPRWMHEQITLANYVLCVASPRYIQRVEGLEEPGKGLGAKWEGAIIYQSLYEAEGRDAKFIPVAFSRKDGESCIPLILRGPTRYVLEGEKSYVALYRRLTGQVRVPIPPVGEIRILAPEAVLDPQGTGHDKPSQVFKPAATVQSKAVLRLAQSNSDLDGTAIKLRLLDPDEQAYVIQELLEIAGQPHATAVLGAIAKRPPAGIEIQSFVTSAMKAAVLLGDTQTMTEFMRHWPVEVVREAATDVREVFFQEIIRTMNADQYEDVNRITPAVGYVLEAVPPSLHSIFVHALVSQADSGAFQGAPAARGALRRLPESMAVAALESITPEYLAWNADSEGLTLLLESTREVWPSKQSEMLREYLEMKPIDFFDKYLHPET